MRYLEMADCIFQPGRQTLPRPQLGGLRPREKVADVLVKITQQALAIGIDVICLLNRIMELLELLPEGSWLHRGRPLVESCHDLF
jgi:hypothetical protein